MNDDEHEVDKPDVASKRGRKRQWKKAFLEAFKQIGVIAPAAAHCGISRHAVRMARLRDPKFAADFDEALETSTERLEAVAFSRASREKEPSDVLLIFLLKARKPEVYRETRFALQHSGPNEGPIQTHVTGSVLVLPAEEIDRLNDGEAERLSGNPVNGENGGDGGEEGEQGNGTFYTPARPTA